MRIVGKFVAVTVLMFIPQAPPAPPAAPPVRLALTALKPEATIALTGEGHFAVAPAGVWLISRSQGTGTLIDAATNKTGAPVALGKGPCQGAVVAFKSLWTPLCDQPGVARAEVAADPPKVAVISAGRAERSVGPLTTGTGSIWMITDRAGTVARIDPDTNAVVAEVTVPGGAGALAFGQDAVWVASPSTNTVSRINGYSNVLTDTIKVGAAPTGVAIGEGSVWTWNAGDGSVSRIDPKANKVSETIKTGVKSTGGAIAVGEGSVWVSAPGAPLIRIDPVTNQLAQLFSGPDGGVIAIGHGSLWITATQSGVWRIDPKRVVATRK
jgi:virginiamycin B lyase